MSREYWQEWSQAIRGALYVENFKTIIKRTKSWSAFTIVTHCQFYTMADTMENTLPPPKSFVGLSSKKFLWLLFNFVISEIHASYCLPFHNIVFCLEVNSEEPWHKWACPRAFVWELSSDGSNHPWLFWAHPCLRLWWNSLLPHWDGFEINNCRRGLMDLELLQFSLVQFDSLILCDHLELLFMVKI